jgi:hypothetical protein
MTLRHATPLTWRGTGLSDTLDASQSMEGSMAVLQNLIQDPTTAGVWICRPAAQLLIDFNLPGSGAFSSGFSSGFQITFFPGVNQAGQISVVLVIGDNVYGMIGGPSGFDYPFIFNMISKTLVTVGSAFDTTKLPHTVPQTGSWTPPVLALVGTKVILTHPGFLGGGSNLYFGWFDINNPAAPVWNAGNLGGAVTFLTPPNYVANFNGRAYYLQNPPTGTPAAIFSDVLVPLNVTNASQIITFDDQVQLTALAPLPLSNQVTGGIIQALMVFKSSSQTYQITGDAALTNLAKNALNVATGTDGPQSIAVTPKGIAFAAPDGLRIIDFNAQITDPIGWDGYGKVLPFLNSGVPSRMMGAATGTYYRVTVQDVSLPGAPFVEYWFDIVRGKWSGPHTFPAYTIDQYKNTFVLSAIGIPGKLWQSDTRQNAQSVFIENNVQMQFLSQTSLLPATDKMEENFMVETTIDMGMQSNAVYPVTVNGAAGDVIQQAQITLPSLNPTWGTAVWGAFTWGATAGVLFPRPVAWSEPVVFQRMKLQISGPCDINVKLGAWRCRYQATGYLQQSMVA